MAAMRDRASKLPGPKGGPEREEQVKVVVVKNLMVNVEFEFFLVMVMVMVVVPGNLETVPVFCWLGFGYILTSITIVIGLTLIMKRCGRSWS